MTTDNNQITNWILPKPINKDEIQNCSINYTLQKVLCRRGIDLEDELNEFLSPGELPNPEEHFKQLKKATNRIIDACKNNLQIAICGDYDADGITSTVLLIELLTKLGGKALPYIPSRQEDGYGLNIKMINDIYLKGIKLVITVDNGISAFEAIRRSNELDIDLIITDHHKITDTSLEIFSLIHPENSPKDSPYRCLAGVGIAYMIARNICNKLDYNIDKTTASVLFCIGTIADMAPLIGANRKWLKEYLPKVNCSENLGIRKIIKKLSLENTYISSDDIGYKIAPLINAVGRIGDPKLIIDLLTNSSEYKINKLSKECFSINKERKRLTALAENEAIKIGLREYSNNNKFIVIANKEWHPGIIGIVAARIVDKYNLPAAVISSTKDGIFRGSVRSNNQINVNSALNECKELLIAHGGHSEAAGFSINEENIPKLKEMLNTIAKRELNNFNSRKSINPDAYISLKDINHDFYRQLILIGPFGIKNKTPIFWTRKCRILSLYILKGNHKKMTLDDGTGLVDAIEWNSSSHLNTDDLIDIAFYIEINKWKNSNNMQLNIIDIKKHNEIIDIELHKRIYKCKITEDMKIEITNSKGQRIIGNLPISSQKENHKEDLFKMKILSFAEIALGKTA